MGHPSAGFIDVFTQNEIIQIKHYRNWKNGVGQVKAYGEYYPLHEKRLHLFGREGDRASKNFEMATKLCAKEGIRVIFEQVVAGSDKLGVDVVDGTDVFEISEAIEPLVGPCATAMSTETDGNSVVGKGGIKRKAEGQSISLRENKKGVKMQEKFDRRRRLIVEMNRLFVEWARLYRTANPSQKSKAMRPLLGIRSTAQSRLALFSPNLLGMRWRKWTDTWPSLRNLSQSLTLQLVVEMLVRW